MPSPLEGKELPAPQTPPPPIQILDAIAFEELYKAKKIELFDHSSSEPVTTAKAESEPVTTAKPETAVKPVKKVISLKEKIYILTSSIIPAIGFGLGNTIAVLLKFVAPIAVVGGAGLAISTGLMIGLTGGFGFLALGLVFMMYHNSIKDAIKKIDLFNNQLERLQDEINLKAVKILKDFNNAFAMLLKMKLALEQLKRTRKTSGSDKETIIERRIDSYINFLVQHPDHPNFQKIQDAKLRKEEIEGADKRQKKIRDKLDEISKEILNDNTVSVNDYIQRAEDYAEKLKEDKIFRDNCFPSFHFVAPKAKLPPFININLKEFLTAFFGAFGGIFGLPFLTITLIGTFTVIPMAFPPLYPILALGIVYGMYNVYRINDTKKLEAERNVEKLNMQKHLAYYHYSHNKLLRDRLTTELNQYTRYQRDVIATEFSPKLQSSPEFKKPPITEPASLQSKAVDYIPSSDEKLTISTAGEDLSFNEPLPKPAPSITTPGFSVFSSSSRNLSFSSSNQNLPSMEKLEAEDLRFDAPPQLSDPTKQAAFA